MSVTINYQFFAWFSFDTFNSALHFAVSCKDANPERDTEGVTVVDMIHMIICTKFRPFKDSCMRGKKKMEVIKLQSW